MGPATGMFRMGLYFMVLALEPILKRNSWNAHSALSDP